MSVEQNIIDTLKNQGTNPDLAQIILIKKLCEMQSRKNFLSLKFFSKLARINNIPINIVIKEDPIKLWLFSFCKICTA